MDRWNPAGIVPLGAGIDNGQAVPLARDRAPDAAAAISAADWSFLSARVWRVGPGWNLPQRRLADDFWFQPLLGSLDATCDGTTRTVDPGSCWLVREGLPHAARRSHGTRHLTILALHTRALDPGGCPVLTNCPPPVLPPLPTDLIRLLVGLRDGDPTGAALLRAWLVQQAWIGAWPWHPPAQPDPRILRAMAAADEGRASVATLAQAAGIGQVRLRQLFHATTGMGPKAWLATQRLRRAEALLRGGATVAAAALEAGFDHPGHLRRWFRRAHATTPGVWRQGSPGGV